jgi:hypothetical protein
MKSLKTKLLCAAILAAGGVQAVHAQTCPTTPTAWTSFTQDGGTVAITTPGFASTNCKVSMSIGATAVDGSRAQVRDETPATETRYRARFLVNLNGLGALTTTARARLFNGQFNPGNAGVFQLRVEGAAAGGYIVTGFASCSNSVDGDGRCRFSFPIASGDTVNRIEVEWVRATSANATDGAFRYWVNASGASPAPTGTVTGVGGAGLQNFSIPGVDQVNLGLIRPNANFRAQEVGSIVSFDEFESRRQTYIGG